MARTLIASLAVALCLVAAVAGHNRYGYGGVRPGVGVHGGAVHGGVLGGGVHGGGIHGGVLGSSIHGGALGGVHGGALGGGVHGGVLGGGVHGGVLGGGVHGGALGGGVHGGVLGGGVHGLGGLGSGSFNAAHYPNLVSGFGFFDTQPVGQYSQCKYWCRSSYTRKYYCCSRPHYG